MAEGMTLIESYLIRTEGRDWEWGRVDCTMWVADWCVERWGMDPAAAYRERYSSEAEALALTANGLANLVGPSLDAFLSRKSAPDEGDVAVIDLLGRETAALRIGGRWAFRTPAGIGESEAQALVIWGD